MADMDTARLRQRDDYVPDHRGDGSDELIAGAPAAGDQRALDW